MEIFRKKNEHFLAGLKKFRNWLDGGDHLTMKNKNTRKILFSLGVFIGAAQFPLWPASSMAIQHVILVSIDGLKPESYTQADHYGLKIPNLREIMKNGAFSIGARSVMPANTYPSHTSIVTGQIKRSAKPLTSEISFSSSDDTEITLRSAKVSSVRVAVVPTATMRAPLF